MGKLERQGGRIVTVGFQFLLVKMVYDLIRWQILTELGAKSKLARHPSQSKKELRRSAGARSVGRQHFRMSVRAYIRPHLICAHWAGVEKSLGLIALYILDPLILFRGFNAFDHHT